MKTAHRSHLEDIVHLTSKATRKLFEQKLKLVFVIFVMIIYNYNLLPVSANCQQKI